LIDEAALAEKNIVRGIPNNKQNMHTCFILVLLKSIAKPVTRFQGIQFSVDGPMTLNPENLPRGD